MDIKGALTTTGYGCLKPLFFFKREKDYSWIFFSNCLIKTMNRRKDDTGHMCSTSDEYDSILAGLDERIMHLINVRNAIIIKKARSVEIKCMNKRAAMLNDILTKASCILDASEALLYCNAFVLPWRHYLPHKYFNKTMAQLPESFPSQWNDNDASVFFLGAFGALEQDRLVLASLVP